MTNTNQYVLTLGTNKVQRISLVTNSESLVHFYITIVILQQSEELKDVSYRRGH